MLAVFLWRARRDEQQLRRRQRVHAWREEYDHHQYFTMSTAEGVWQHTWSASLIEMTLRLAVSHAERFQYDEPDAEYALHRKSSGAWFRRTTADSWSSRYWWLRAKVAEPRILPLPNHYRRELRCLLRTRPDWEAVDASLARKLEEHHQALRRAIASRPPAKDASDWRTEFLLRSIDQHERGIPTDPAWLRGH